MQRKNEKERGKTKHLYTKTNAYENGDFHTNGGSNLKNAADKLQWHPAVLRCRGARIPLLPSTNISTKSEASQWEGTVRWPRLPAGAAGSAGSRRAYQQYCALGYLTSRSVYFSVLSGIPQFPLLPVWPRQVRLHL